MIIAIYILFSRRRFIFHAFFCEIRSRKNSFIEYIYNSLYRSRLTSLISSIENFCWNDLTANTSDGIYIQLIYTCMGGSFLHIFVVTCKVLALKKFNQ